MSHKRIILVLICLMGINFSVTLQLSSQTAQYVENADFENGTIDPWTVNKAGLTSYGYYVHTGKFGLRLANYISDSEPYYPASAEQVVNIPVSNFTYLTFYMRSIAQKVYITFNYNNGLQDTFTFKTSDDWIQRYISINDTRSDISAQGEMVSIIKITFERRGTSSVTTAIDDVQVNVKPLDFNSNLISESSSSVIYFIMVLGTIIFLAIAFAEFGGFNWLKKKRSMQRSGSRINKVCPECYSKLNEIQSYCDRCGSKVN